MPWREEDDNQHIEAQELAIRGITTAPAPWRVVEWTDVNGRVVKELAFHESEQEQVVNLPFPPGAVVREPVMQLTNLARAKPYRWFRRQHDVLRVGEVFAENINQGDRLCRVLAVDEETGHILYDYEMPNGRVYHRISGRPVSLKRLPAKWRKLLE